MLDTPITLQLPHAVKGLWTAQQELAKHYADTGLKFTLDGRLVGDIAEALALHHFDLLVPEKRTGGVDARTRSGKTVQVKATGKRNTGPAFTPGKGRADYLLFFALDFERSVAVVVYNGPEAPVRAMLPDKWEGTKVLALAGIHALAKRVAISDRIPQSPAVDRTVEYVSHTFAR
ncbi:DUF6998 domain-containing protein [Paraburkholderia phenazinium]|jgi:hypothetical protein|uniref:DUF6998 domain-containing protein n=1 Tax=Paraburkholderia phenazinium TaxID=60549 RepID=A0A1N6KPM7_9BURK|nr:hypothetical protein [Paraburkholderia phenazinium]SIO58552.1 hypothetical protein SAMN05444165_4189 [Paraburkholderia phenazinium]